MKIARFSYKKKIRWGAIEDDSIRFLKNSPYKKIEFLQKKIPTSKVKLLPPANPTKVILVGLNYKDHAKELGMKIPAEPIMFLKPTTALVGNKDFVNYPRGVKRLDYEAELAFVIKKKAKNVLKHNAHKYILGFGCLNDVTARDIQVKELQWSRAKSYDTFCPFGPWIETEWPKSKVKVESYLNGKLKQSSSINNFIFSIKDILCFISQVMTLFPGDVISTGTPYGVGPMKRGDKVEVKIDGIGALENKVR